MQHAVDCFIANVLNSAMFKKMKDSDLYSVCPYRMYLVTGKSSSLADAPHAANYIVDKRPHGEKYQCWSELGTADRNSHDKAIIRHGTQLQ